MMELSEEDKRRQDNCVPANNTSDDMCSESKKTNEGERIVNAAVGQPRVESIRLNGFGTDSLLEVRPCIFEKIHSSLL